MLVKIRAILSEIATLEKRPRSGVGSIYINNRPEFGGYEVREIIDTNGEFDTWGLRMPPQDMYSYLKRRKFALENKKNI